MKIAFEAMGTGATIVVVEHSGTRASATALLEQGVRRIRQLEDRWSRFLPTSEVSALNRKRATPVLVSADTRLLVRRAVEGWRLTGGRFDPTVHDSVRAVGYDRTFTEVKTAQGSTNAPISAGLCGEIVVADDVGAVTLPRAGGFDPGGIGKGLAADLVADELLLAGAAGVCVEIGGDIRVAGHGPEDRGWVVSVAHPVAGCAEAGRIWLRDGAVASSSTRKRVWVAGHEARHHIVEPRTGRPTAGPIGATAVARSAWLAEVLATATCVEPDGHDIESTGTCGFIFGANNSTKFVGNLADFLA